MHAFYVEPGIRRLLRESVSVLAFLATGLAATGSAEAAAYTASNQTELVSAINAANASGDASSTITLTSSFTFTSVLPEVTKTLTIDTGDYLLTASGAQSWKVGATGSLTVLGNTKGNASSGSGEGRLRLNGAGNATLTGVSGDYFGGITVSDSGTLLINGGSQIVMGNSTADGSVNLNGSGAPTLIISGAGTKVTARNGSGSVGTAAGATMTVEKGATYKQVPATVTISSNGTYTGTVNVTDAGSLFDVTAIAVGAGRGYINVTAGGKILTTTTSIGSLNTLDRSGTGTLLVSGRGSIWENTGTFAQYRGTLDVLDGGRVDTSIMRIAVVAANTATNSSVRVSGTGSTLTTSSAAANAFQIAGGNNAGVKVGALTIANGGTVRVGATGTGTIDMATHTASSAVLNIGGAVGEAATGAGTLNAGEITFGTGTSVLNFNHTDVAFGFDIGITSGSGSGTINQVGSGKTVFTANQTAFTGKTNVLNGILAVNGTLGGTMDVLDGRLQGTGSVGTTTNYAGGTIAPGNSIGTLTVVGDYASEGGDLEIEAEFGDDFSPTDLLVITGNSLLGAVATQVRVINVGGFGALTTGDGIKIVDVQGETSDADAFFLANPGIGGIYRYDMFQHDLLGTLDDGDWYLRSTGLAPTLPTYEAYPVVLLGLIDLPTLQQRVGDRHVAADAGKADGYGGVWTRIEAAHARAEGQSTLGISYDSGRYLVQIGADGQFFDNGSGSLVGGINAQYSRDTADVGSAIGDGSNAADSYSLGATLTWYGTDGVYVDAQAQIAALRSKLGADGLGVIGDNLKGFGYSNSLEAGRRVGLGNGWAMTPQAQLVYSSVDFDAFTDPFGAELSLRDGDSLKGRLGLALERETSGGKVYGLANLTYEFLEGTSIKASGEVFDFKPDAFGAELGIGGTHEWADGKYALHGEALVRTSFAGSYGYKGTVGFSSRF